MGIIHEVCVLYMNSKYKRLILQSKWSEFRKNYFKVLFFGKASCFLGVTTVIILLIKCKPIVSGKKRFQWDYFGKKE